MARLRARGLLVEPENVRLAKLARKRRRRQRYAIRRPKDYKVEEPGDLVQVDTLHARLVPDERRIQFRAHDVISKRGGALRVYKRQTSGAAAEFLYHLKMKFPYRSEPSRSTGLGVQGRVREGMQEPRRSPCSSAAQITQRTGMF